MVSKWGKRISGRFGWNGGQVICGGVLVPSGAEVMIIAGQNSVL